MFKGLYEVCTVTVGDDGNPIYPYFNKNLLRNYVNDFVATNVGKFAPSYDLSINFYSLDGITECSEDDLARNVKVRLKAELNYLFSYDKEQIYSIQERGNLNE